jgi:mitochondrial inner membrane protease subunit 2
VKKCAKNKNRKKKTEENRIKMLNFAKNVLLSGVVGVTFIDVFGYIARVEGESMKPTLNPFPQHTDYVYLNKLKARDYKVVRGEVICLISPKDPSQRIIKRVIAREGDVISTIGYKEKFVKIPAGYFWVEGKVFFLLLHVKFKYIYKILGDHINNSLDSNTFGPVPLGLLTAKATHIIWPPSRWRTLSSEPVRQPLKLGKSESLNS